MRFVGVVIVGVWCVMITGCAPTRYVHPTKNAADFEQDKYDCTVEAEHSAASSGQAGNYIWIANRAKYCLQAKHGWRPEQKSAQVNRDLNSEMPQLFLDPDQIREEFEESGQSDSEMKEGEKE